MFVSLDDDLLIYKNPAVQEITIKSLWFISTHYDPELYIPLTFFSYQIDHLVWGLNPFGFHLTNLAIAVCVAWALFWAAMELTGSRLTALLCAVLFLIHPLNTEAILWAAARKDLLSGLFFFLSIGWYLSYRRDGGRRWLLFSIVAFALGLLSKVSIILLPVILMLVDWYQGRVFTRDVWKEKVPYAVLSAIFGIIAVVGKSGVIASSSTRENVLLAAKSTVFYLQKIIWPSAFSVIYPQHTPVTLGSLEFLIPLLLCVLLAAAAVMLRRYRIFAFGVAWYMILLVPNFTNFLKNGFLFFASDRYAFLASAGIFLLVASVVDRLIHSGTRLRIAVPWLTVALLLVLASQAYRQAGSWQNSETLYRTVIAQYPESALAHTNLGSLLKMDGRRAEAEAEISAALAIDPQLTAAHINRGDLLKEKGDIAGSVAAYEKAVEPLLKKQTLNIDEVAAFYVLAMAYEGQGRGDDALTQYEIASLKAPHLAEPQYNVGLQYEKLLLTDKAIAAYRRAVELNPHEPDAHYHLAGLLAEQGKLPEALAELEAVLAINPTYPNAAGHAARIRQMMR